jgi:hypothetical protein
MRRWSLLLDLALLAASISVSGPVGDGVRAIGIIVAGILGGLVVFVAAVFTVAILDQRKPPYPV